MFLRIDGTFFVQLVNFAIFFAVLNVVFLKPVGAAIRKRREYIESVIRGRKHEEHFLERWQTYRREILALASRCRSVNLNSLVDGLQRLICLHLGSRGKK